MSGPLTTDIEVTRPWFEGRTRRVYRAVAWYPMHGGGEYPVARHFQTRRARDRWADQRLEGYPEHPGLTWDDEGLPAIKPALRVEVADSEPVIFPPSTCLFTPDKQEGAE